jgi:arginase family enzyme
MKDLSIYLSPLESGDSFRANQIGSVINSYTTTRNFPELKKGGIAFFHVPEYRGDRKACPHNAEQFRYFLYSLHLGVGWDMPMYDLGNVLPGATLTDTYFAVSQIVGECVKHGVIPLLVGGSQDLTIAMYKGYESLEQIVNSCSVDYALDLGSPEEEAHAEGFLSHLLMQRPCYLFNHANIGVQAPFVSREEFDLFDKLYFDICRLGEYNANFRIAEPHLRNSDFLSIDFSSIRGSELREPWYTSPNGFYGDQICQIAKYAGISDKLTAMGVFNYYPEFEAGSASALMAQVLWYFIDGVSQRKGDFPIGSKRDYVRFSVQINDFKEELIFYKSHRSERWWMEVPYPPQKGSNYERHHLVPCDAMDYERAMKNEIPDLWWKTYQKLS